MLLLLPPAWLALVGNARVTPLRMAATGPCESAAWPLLQAALDKLPVFTVANSEEQPLQYQVGERKLAVFYADVKVATNEYIAARDRADGGETALVGCDIIQIGLGAAYKLSVGGTAMIVPGMAELQAAGAPEDAQPMGQELPLFACMEMKLEGDAGPKGRPRARLTTPTATLPVPNLYPTYPTLTLPCPCPYPYPYPYPVPLFMSYDDCAAAVAQESNADAPLEINAVLSLQSLVEELGELSVDEALQAPSGEFALQAPSASLQHGASYVGSGVYMRKVAEEDA